MKIFFDEYGSLIICALCCSIITQFFISSLLPDTLNNSINIISKDINNYGSIKNIDTVKIKSFTVKDYVVYIGDTFDYKKRVEAYNSNDESIKDYISISNDIDLNKLGEQEIEYVLRYNGESMSAKAKLIILER